MELGTTTSAPHLQEDAGMRCYHQQEKLKERIDGQIDQGRRQVNVG